MRKRQIVPCRVQSPKLTKPLTLGVVTDLHNGAFRDLLPWLKKTDAILVVGDLVNRHGQGFENAVNFLKEAPQLAPTFYAIGNHEWKFKEKDAYWAHVLDSQVQVLDNQWTVFQGMAIGGFSSTPTGQEDLNFLIDMEAFQGFKLLMVHHPERYAKWIAHRNVDLSVAGHAHGGQVELFGQGLFAPGQGLFPTYTHGFYDEGRLLVSRGLTNSAWLPRFNNPCELLMLTLSPGEAAYEVGELVAVDQQK